MSERLRLGFFSHHSRSLVSIRRCAAERSRTYPMADRCGYDEAWLGENHSAGTE